MIQLTQGDSYYVNVYGVTEVITDNDVITVVKQQLKKELTDARILGV